MQFTPLTPYPRMVCKHPTRPLSHCPSMYAKCVSIALLAGWRCICLSGDVAPELISTELPYLGRNICQSMCAASGPAPKVSFSAGSSFVITSGTLSANTAQAILLCQYHLNTRTKMVPLRVYLQFCRCPLAIILPMLCKAGGAEQGGQSACSLTEVGPCSLSCASSFTTILCP